MRIPTISHHMADLPPDILCPIRSGLLSLGAVRFPESTTTSLSRSSNGSPTAIEFAKAGAEHHFHPPSTPGRNLWDTCGDRYESAAKAPTPSGGLVQADMVTRMLSKLSARRHLRTRMCLALQWTPASSDTTPRYLATIPPCGLPVSMSEGKAISEVE
jgi:hypothetical protein